MSLFVVSAPFGDVAMSLFVAGAAFGDVGASLFVAGATFGDVGTSLFVAGAACGEVLGNSTSAKCCILQYNCLAGRGKVSSANGRVQFSIILGSCSDHSRIVRHCKRRVLRFVSKSWRGFSWQGQYLVNLERHFL